MHGRLRRPGDGIGVPTGLSYWSCPPDLWRGETVFVLAGGPSLIGFDAGVLLGRGRVLAIKESCLLAPFADALLFVDAPWFDRERALIDRFAGPVVTTATNAALHPCVRLMKRGLDRGLADAPDTLNYAATVVYAALNLIAHAGAARAVLLGMDHGFDAAGPARHHDRNPLPPPPGAFTRQAEALATISGPLAERGVDVLNATPGSRLTLWPRAELKELL